MTKVTQYAGFGLLLAACTSATFPKVESIAETIIHDLQVGDTEAQLASDVCADLGGTALTDAVCGDVATVIAGLIPVLMADPKTPASVKPQLAAMKVRIATGMFLK